MKLTTVKEIYKNREEYLNREVTVGGWVRSVRGSKAFGFIVLHDGTFFETLQVVYHDNMPNFAEISKLNVGAAIIVRGTLVPTPEAKQPFEIQADEVQVEGASAPDYPLQKKRHTLEYLRTMTHLRPRTNTFQAVFRVRSLCAYAIHKFFQERGFVYVHTPLITGSDCEGAGEMFQVTTLDMKNPPLNEDGTVDYSQDFFGKETNLTVSGQLNGETYAQAFRNIYTFGPTFRAENSNTTRHAAEFWMIEPECAFADLNDNMDLAEDMLKYVIRYVLENAPEEMNFFNSFIDKGLLDRLNHVVDSEFGHVTYTEAIELLEKNNDKFDYKVFWGCDLQTEHERYLTEEIFKKPVFVTDYPKEIKAFYMKQNEDGKTVAAMDCLVPGIGEIIGGSQREDDYDKLKARMDELGLKAEDLKSRYLYNTNYVIWDNVGLQKQDKNIPAYQLMSEILNRLDIHSGTVFNYHQQRKGTKNYLSDLELLQYDILYGKQYVYNNHPPIAEGHMVMGIRDVSLSSIVPQLSSGYSLYGENFTKYSRVYVNGEKQKSSFLNNTRINLSETELQDGDVIQVGQVGSSDTIFRMSDKYIYQNGQLVKQEGTATDKDKSWVDQEYDVK